MYVYPAKGLLLNCGPEIIKSTRVWRNLIRRDPHTTYPPISFSPVKSDPVEYKKWGDILLIEGHSSRIETPPAFIAWTELTFSFTVRCYSSACWTHTRFNLEETDRILSDTAYSLFVLVYHTPFGMGTNVKAAHLIYWMQSFYEAILLGCGSLPTHPPYFMWGYKNHLTRFLNRFNSNIDSSFGEYEKLELTVLYTT